MANYIEAAEFIAQELKSVITDILENDTFLHRYFEFISYCSQVYFEYVSSELDPTFVKLNYKIVPRPYRFFAESRISLLAGTADRIFCIESINKEKYIFIAGCEQIIEENDIENYVFAFNCDYFGISALKSFSMFYLTLCEALSIFRKNNAEYVSNLEFSKLNSWVRQHSGKLSKQYFMANEISPCFNSFGIYARFLDFQLTSTEKTWGLSNIYQRDFPEGITICADKHTFTVLKEVGFSPSSGGVISSANCYLSRHNHIDLWSANAEGRMKATLLHQPSVHADSFKDIVDDLRKYIIDEIQF